MAALSEVVLKAIWGKFVSEVSSLREPLPGKSADIYAAVVAVDAWLDSQYASLLTSMNDALPAITKQGLSEAQKRRLLAALFQVRFGL